MFGFLQVRALPIWALWVRVISGFNLLGLGPGRARLVDFLNQFGFDRFGFGRVARVGALSLVQLEICANF